ncbi:glycosyltransferase [Ensifer adhaerens]|uniref:CgeB family protein n=1 Tax=Ensifer adhaerens TaxID=106592 RepID=UPI00384D6520
MQSNKLVIALVADSLTTSCLAKECRTLTLTPLNYRWILRFQKPDLLFVESAWEGHRSRWKYKVATYPGGRNNNRKLEAVVSYARDLGIPTVFWNKEDGVHFDRFIDSARLFDHIFTVDANCVEKYKNLVGKNVTVNTLMFPVQTETHFFRGFEFKSNSANFVGSYSRKIHESRRVWQDLMFSACASSGIKTVVYDRNSERISSNYRYPDFAGMDVRASIPHADTAQVYRDHLISLNVNTIDNSPSMYSRRLVEILACGGIAVTNPSPAVDRYFVDYCNVVKSSQEAEDLFARLKYGPSAQDLQRAEAGARYVQSEHTWSQRLDDVRRVIGL